MDFCNKYFIRIECVEVEGWALDKNQSPDRNNHWSACLSQYF